MKARTVRRITASTLLFVANVSGGGCLARSPIGEPAVLRPDATIADYSISADLDPAKSHVQGQARIRIPAGRDTVTLKLLEGLKLTAVEARGAALGKRSEATNEEHKHKATEYTIELKPSAARPELLVSWEGKLYQDPSAGEAAGQIHNFAMRASVGTDGVYLTDAWYPKLTDDAPANYELSLNRPEGLPLVAAGELDAAASKTAGRDIWYTPYPIREQVVVGSAHEVYTTTWRGLEIALHLKPSQKELAPSLEASVQRYLTRFEPLLGPLPTQQYRIVDNYFSSGFAFPGFTLLSSPVIEMGPTSQDGHGYIDHEFVHTWFGAGIHSDDKTGDWCEALTSYTTNHYGFILDGDPKGARKYRRDASNSFSKLAPEQDVPLAKFGNDENVSRTIGYNKGALVFHALAQEIGQETFWDAIRHITARQTGRVTSWADLQRYFEEASGRDLQWFFEQWVQGNGAVEIRPTEATWDAAKQELHLPLEKPANLRVTLPIALGYAGDTRTVRQPVAVGDKEIILAGITQKPQSVVIDPDYDLLERIPADEQVPVLDATRRAAKVLAIVDKAQEEKFASYLELFKQSSNASQYRSGAKAGGGELTVLPDTAAKDFDWSNTAVFIVGDAVRSEAAKAVLAQIESPVRILPNGFAVGEKEYTDPKDGLLATFRHPKLPGAGVTILLENAPGSAAKANVLPFYPNSIVVFSGGRAGAREDLEFKRVIEVK